MRTFILTTMVVILTILGLGLNSIQAQNPYGELNFIKTLPDMNESFLIDMKTSKKLANGRVANKTITSWQLYRRVYPRGSNMDYNYATLSVFPSGVEMKAEGTWDAPVRELSVSEIASFLTSINNVRTTVATDLMSYKMGVGSRVVPGDHIQINSVNVIEGRNNDYEKLIESLKPVFEECIKAGKLKAINMWKRTYATNINGEIDYFVSFSFSTLDQALSWVSGKSGIADEYKKVYPKDDISNLYAKLSEMRDIVSQELWELVDITD
jgi:hypothetical protein